MGWKELLSSLFEQPAEQSSSERVNLAASVLLVEIARADFDDHPAEADAICALLIEHFGLEPELARQLLDEARATHDNSVSLEPYVRIVNEHMPQPRKVALLEALWRVAYADGELHRYEEHMIRRVAELLFLPHAEFMQAKHRVMQEL